MAEYQEIIVLVIIVLAFAFAGFKIYRSLTNPLKGCSGCESDCSGCQLQDLKKQIEENKKNKGQVTPTKVDS